MCFCCTVWKRQLFKCEIFATAFKKAQFLLSKIVQSTEQIYILYTAMKNSLGSIWPVHNKSVFIDSVFECERNEIPRQSKTSIHLSSSEKYWLRFVLFFIYWAYRVHRILRAPDRFKNLQTAKPHNHLSDNYLIIMQFRIAHQENESGSRV